MLANPNSDINSIGSSCDHKKIEENDNEASNNKNTLFQLLPFRTDFYGSTDIDVNFTEHTTIKEQVIDKELNNNDHEGDQRTNEEHDSVYRNQFRGRTLIGKKVHLPERMCIVAVQNLSELQNSSRHIPVYAANSHFMSWEHDYEPENVKVIAQWTEIAKVIHDDENL